MSFFFVCSERFVYAASKEDAELFAQEYKKTSENYNIDHGEMLYINNVPDKEIIIDVDMSTDVDDVCALSIACALDSLDVISLSAVGISVNSSDGTHIEDGVEVSHKAGDLKLNDNGRPYYETLGNREIYNKDVLRMSDVLTVDGSPWNAVDIFDKDDIKVGAGKVALNMVARVAPYLIPYVGQV